MAEQDLASILATCLDAVARGEATVEQCLARYPAHRDELARLLRSAQQLRAAPAALPSPAFRRAARGRLLGRLPPRATARRGLAPRGLLGVLAGAGALAALLLLVVGAGLLAWLYTARPMEVALGTLVRVQAPASGSLVELNQSLRLEASAQDSAGLTRLEVYADGALVAAQDATLADGQQVLLLLAQRWVPPTPGRHVLMARTYRTGGGFVDSSVVYLDVAERPATIKVNVDDIPRPDEAPVPSLNEVATAAGVPLADVLAANSSLAGTDPAAPLPQGTLLAVPRLPLPPPGTEGGVPLPELPAPLAEAPAPGVGLALAVTCETAALSWLPDGPVAGWTVYRLDPGAESFKRVAALPATATAYEDTLPFPGDYRYQLAAMDAGLEGMSPMSVGRSPLDCAAPEAPAGTVALLVTLDALETEAVYASVYCYFSLDGAPYQRAPAGDFVFLYPEAEGRHYDLTAWLEQGGHLLLAHHPEKEPVTMEAECLGRVGEESVPIGTVLLSQGPEAWNNAPQVADGEGLRLGYRIAENALQNRLDPSRSLSGDLVMPPVQRAYDLPRPTNLRLQGSAEACDEVLDMRGRGACVLAVLLGGAPTLLWDWSPDAGYPGGTVTGYHIIGTATTLDTGAQRVLFERDVTRRATRASNLGLPCGTRLSYTVSARAGILTSLPSDPIFIETEPCRAGALVTIAVQTLRLGVGPSGDEGDVCIACDTNTAELRGDIMASALGFFQTKSLAPDGITVCDHLMGRCPWLPPHEGRVDPWTPLPAQTHAGSGLYWLTRVGYLNGPSQNNESILMGLYGRTQQHLQLILLFFLDEYDGAGPPFGDFRVYGGSPCYGNLNLVHTLAEWQSINETYTFDYATERGDVNCTLTFTITGAAR